MQLSILIPSHRADPLTCARLAQACSWAGPQVEVVIRDNSCDAAKRDLLAQFSREHCNLVFADECGPMENYAETLNLAQGEFVFFVADDDLAFDRAIAALPEAIAASANDSSVAGITGLYAVETSKNSAVGGYQEVDASDAAARLNAYLSFGGPNLLIYSAIRRTIISRVFNFVHCMPFSFSFHDQIVCMLYLLNGKFVKLNRLLYLYDNSEWETAEKAQKRDLDFYKAAGVDPALNKLQWFVCGFEGAVLIRNSDLFPDHAPAQRQVMADRWFGTMYQRFVRIPRDGFGSPHADHAEALRTKWKTSAGQLSFEGMLVELCGFLALSSEDHARKYLDFWKPILAGGRNG
jgi:hypothetical protein